MTLSIITINYNNAEGLRRTLASVASQTYRDIKHIIIDGGSTDGSVDVIREYEKQNSLLLGRDGVGLTIKWLSEPDTGIYNAMNKGIEIALGRRIVNSINRSELVEDKHGEADRPEQSGVENKDIEIALGKRAIDTFNRSGLIEDKNTGILRAMGDYIQILNSGDILTAPDVTERMMKALQVKSEELRAKSEDGKFNSVELLYGNMVKYDYTSNKVIGKSGKVDYSLRQYYRGTMNHDCCYIRRDLFDIYGLYDENLKIVSDWKWFLQVIGLGNVKPLYVDIDVTIFDASGISETNLELRNKERRQVLEEVMPPAVLADYDRLAFPMEQYMQLKKYHLWGIAYFMERVLFKLNRWGLLR